MAKKTTPKTGSEPSGKSAEAKEAPRPAPPKETMRKAARRAPGETDVPPRATPVAARPEPAARLEPAARPGPAAKPEAPTKPEPRAKPEAPKPLAAEAAPAAPTAAKVGGPKAEAPKPSLTLEQPASLVAELEKRIARGVEHLEAKLGEVSQSVREVLARSLASLAPPAAPPPKAQAPSGPPPAELEDLTASVRRAMAEAIDRKLEEAIGPAVSLYNRLREEERALAKDPSSSSAREARTVLAEAASELEKILRILGGEFIRPKAGEFYDPLIHLAVGEAKGAKPGAGRGETAVVADVVTAGYRSARGKVVCPARVLVEKR